MKVTCVFPEHILVMIMVHASSLLFRTCLLGGVTLFLNFGIIIEEMTAEALAQAAIRLKTDEALYQELARNAEAASKELCFEKEGQKLLRIYQEICGENAEYEAEYLHSARG